MKTNILVSRTMEVAISVSISVSVRNTYKKAVEHLHMECLCNLILLSFLGTLQISLAYSFFINGFPSLSTIFLFDSRFRFKVTIFFVIMQKSPPNHDQTPNSNIAYDSHMALGLNNSCTRNMTTSEAKSFNIFFVAMQWWVGGWVGRNFHKTLFIFFAFSYLVT
jgi:hypothetical protein